MDLTNLLAISLGAILVNNFILVQFLGICPFMGVSKKMDTAVGMGFAVIFVMGIASAFCYVVNLLLVYLDLEFMQTVAFILVIAALVAIVLFASIRERLEFSHPPKCFEGFPIALITAGLMALAFSGFSGLEVWPIQ